MPFILASPFTLLLLVLSFLDIYQKAAGRELRRIGPVERILILDRHGMIVATGRVAYCPR